MTVKQTLDIEFIVIVVCFDKDSVNHKNVFESYCSFDYSNNIMLCNWKNVMVQLGNYDCIENAKQAVSLYIIFLS